MRGSVQAPRAVVLVRSSSFHPNPETAADNVFQGPASADVARAAYLASTNVAQRLAEAGVAVHLFEDANGMCPDSVFPNNWFSTHSGGRIAVYPMYAANRRAERRHDVVEFLKRAYRVQEVVDYSGLEEDGIYLEGTGAMVLDHAGRIAYVARSKRADPLALERFCTTFGYEPMLFDAVDASGIPIYHTNVMMCVATEFARSPTTRAAPRSRTGWKRAARMSSRSPSHKCASSPATPSSCAGAARNGSSRCRPAPTPR